MEKENIVNFYQIDAAYVDEIYTLQVELLKLQKHIAENKMRLAILFEGRDAAGKGSAILRFSQYLNPSNYRVEALGKPTKKEKGQWYFQRYIKKLPNVGEMVFFDRSWYNRAVVEPAMGFCSKKQHELFMEQVNTFEKLLLDDGIFIIKFWFSIDSEKQMERINKRINSPLQQWKVSPVDLAAKEKWEEFSHYKNIMIEQTSPHNSPWVNIKGDDREYCRIQAMRYVLSQFDYENKSDSISKYDKDVVNILTTSK